MESLIALMDEIGLPFAYHHFAEGESPDPPFVCFMVSGSNNFAADGSTYFKIDAINIELYRKAMNNGMILNSPTIFGASGNRLLGGGEAGPEAVVGVSSLMDMIQKAVSSTQMGDSGDITIPVYIGGNLIDEMIVTAQQRRALRSGGRA